MVDNSDISYKTAELFSDILIGWELPDWGSTFVYLYATDNIGFFAATLIESYPIG